MDSPFFLILIIIFTSIILYLIHLVVKGFNEPKVNNDKTKKPKLK